MQEKSPQNGDRSLGDLFSELTRELTQLVRQEAALAKSEIAQKASEVTKNVGFLAAGGAIAYAGFLALIAGFIIVLAELGLPWWIAALLVGAVVSAAGYFLVQKGLAALKQSSLTPDKTLASLKEHRETMKEHMQ